MFNVVQLCTIKLTLSRPFFMSSGAAGQAVGGGIEQTIIKTDKGTRHFIWDRNIHVKVTVRKVVFLHFKKGFSTF